MAEMSEKTEAEKKIDLVKKIPSPYDLNSSDNPGNLITKVQLKGENYGECSRALRTSLRAIHARFAWHSVLRNNSTLFQKKRKRS